MKKIILTTAFTFGIIISCLAQIMADKSRSPLYVIKSKGQPDIHYHWDSPNIALTTIKQSTIKSIEVLKDSTAKKLYGKGGENGVLIINIADSVILITTKQLLKKYKLERKAYNLPIYIDGIIVKNAEHMYFDPVGIKSLTVETIPYTKEKYLDIKSVGGRRIEPPGIHIRGK